MLSAARLRIENFAQSLFFAFGDSKQLNYLHSYLADLDAKSAIIEPQYFDRDYLDEFAAFYGTSAKAYPNVCQRIHFFDFRITRRALRSFFAGNEAALTKFHGGYLGFAVIRPIPASPLGRTVLRWYPDLSPDTPRNTAPSRDYDVHLAGVRLTVRGLAWQQQDSAVGACATVGLWSMLHSSAFDDHHAIPTTADITRAAHRTASLGSRVFPSTGLTIYQLAEAIKEHKLAPIVISGDSNSIIPGPNKRGFTRFGFATVCGAFVRSGYPVLIGGYLEHVGMHAVCAVGFREPPTSLRAANSAEFGDSYIEHFYIHDDNLGPSVKFKLCDSGPGDPVYLVTDSPPPRFGLRQVEATHGYQRFFPSEVIAAVHDGLRLSPDTLSSQGKILAGGITFIVNDALYRQGIPEIGGLWISCRFLKLSTYLGSDLVSAVKADPTILANARLALIEQVPPMSLHLGVVRIFADNAELVADFLFDTTDGDRQPTIFAHVGYVPQIEDVIDALSKKLGRSLGAPVCAYK